MVNQDGAAKPTTSPIGFRRVITVNPQPGPQVLFVGTVADFPVSDQPSQDDSQRYLGMLLSRQYLGVRLLDLMKHLGRRKGLKRFHQYLPAHCCQSRGGTRGVS